MTVMTTSTNERLLAAFAELRSIGHELLTDVLIQDDMPEADSAAVQVSCVIDVLANEIKGFSLNRDATLLRQLADLVNEWTGDRVGFVLKERAA
jgi:hypothetical protein